MGNGLNVKLEAWEVGEGGAPYCLKIHGGCRSNSTHTVGMHTWQTTVQGHVALVYTMKACGIVEV